MTDKQKLQIIKSFFKKKKISNSLDLFENGFLDSLSVIDLISHIEKKTKKKIQHNKMNIRNFRSINSIQKMIKNF
jgi:methoxymalonate biosynthesis acyl carrier protein